MFSGKEKPKPGFTPLKKSVEGHKADLNRGTGGKDVYFLCKYNTTMRVPSTDSVVSVDSAENLAMPSSSHEDAPHLLATLSNADVSDLDGPPPNLDGSTSTDTPRIHALSIVFSDTFEEPPMGFERVSMSISGKYQANLNGGGNGRQIFLCTRSAITQSTPSVQSIPYLDDIGVVVVERKEKTPAGYHLLRHTPFGSSADMNSGTVGHPLFLCYHLNIAPLLARYAAYIEGEKEHLSVEDLHYHSIFARTFAIMSAALFSPRKQIAMTALEAFRQLPLESVPPPLLNFFIQAVCSAVPHFLSSFNTNDFRALLRFILSVYTQTFRALNLETTVMVMETCMMLRHEDKKDKVSKKLISFVTRHIPLCGVKLRSGSIAGSHTKNESIDSVDGNTTPLRTGASPARATTGANTIPEEELKEEESRQEGDDSSEADEEESRERRNRMDHLTVNHAHDEKGAGSGSEAVVASPSNNHGEISPGGLSPPATPTSRPFSGAESAKGRKNDSTSIPNTPASARRDSDSSDSSGISSSDLENEEDFERNEHAVATNMSKELIHSIIRNVLLSKEVEPHVNSYIRSTSVNALFRFNLCTFLDSTYEDHCERTFLCILLVLAKFSAEHAEFNLQKSEKVKRKAHALSLLLHLLKHSGALFVSDPGSVLSFTSGREREREGKGFSLNTYILRRFVCSQLVECCVTDVPSVFSLVLQLFVFLWSRHRDHLMIELGVMMDHVFIGLLQSTHCTTEQKRDIVDTFIKILHDPATVINVFYNYDNDAKSWNIFEKLIKCLASIIDGEIASPHSLAAENKSGTPDPGQNSLRRRALRLMVNLLYLQAQWIGVPLHKPLPTSKVVDGNGQFITPLAIATMDEKEIESSLIHRSHSQIGPSRLAKPGMDRVATWHIRFHQQKEEAKIRAHALHLARTESVKSALKYLKTVNNIARVAQVFAQFLYRSEGLDPVQVGDLLSGGSDSILDKAGYEDLRMAYGRMLDFTGMTFDQALRMFLCDSGFRLPGEGQKVDRLIDLFAHAYCRDNPNVFRTPSSALILAFATVMLNTDVNDPRLKSGSSSRKAMTMEQFFSNLRGTNDGVDFPRPLLSQIYQDVCANPIEWQADRNALNLENSDSDDEKDGGDLKLFRKQYELTARRGLAILKNRAAHQRTYMTTDSVAIVSGLFDVAWYRCASALTTLLNHTKDVDVLQVCLDGLSYGSCIAIMLGLETERVAFTREIALVTYKESKRHQLDPSEVVKDIVNGAHEKQSWYTPLKMQCKLQPVSACKVILTISRETKQRLSHERNLEKLRSLQQEFGSDIVLETETRVFKKQGVLTKISQSTKRRIDYHFFLFNDLLIYASEGIHSKYKVHRVMHLSLLHVVDLALSVHQEPCLQIVSPQKTITIAFENEKNKRVWMDLLVDSLKSERQRRDSFVKSNLIPRRQSSSPRKRDSDASDESENEHDASVSDTDLNSEGDSSSFDVRRRYSTFLSTSFLSTSSQSSGDVSSPTAKNKSPQNCKLCLRNFSVFRRKHTCSFCRDIICSDCYSHKCEIKQKDRTQRVCDACYGILNGIVSPNTPLVTVEEAQS